MPRSAEGIETAASLMLAFAERTGLTSDGPEHRYLWTDAFAVCNFLALASATGEKRYTDLALQLVDRVHQVLGRYRADDARSGWISGLGEHDATSHPTRGGLRIGKKLPERGLRDPFDERLEWDRDGQYFHYLTKWMHALDQVTRSTGDSRFNRWARELAVIAHAAFTHGPRSGRRRMVWKMSTDLSRPLVSSMGQHDPLDGFITCVQLETTAAQLSSPSTGPSLRECTVEFASMIHAGSLGTADPLGLGGLLMDAGRMAQLELDQTMARDLLEALLAAALDGLAHYAQQNDPGQPAVRRLAFREIGLAIGLFALEILEKEGRRERRRFARTAAVGKYLEHLAHYAVLGSTIQSFWLDPAHRENATWFGHRDINEVMLATSLLPEGFLVLAPLH